MIVLAATAAVAAVIIVSQPGPPAGSNVPRADADVPPATAAEPTTGSVAGDCAPRTLDAPVSGRWVLFRAEYGSRGGHDYLRLKLRRDGAADSPARVQVALVPPAQVPTRYGLEAPSAGAALVVGFEGPVRIPGSFGGRGSGALGQFTIDHGNGGVVYVVAAVNGGGCFEVDGGSWQSGEDSNEVDITLEIERG